MPSPLWYGRILTVFLMLQDVKFIARLSGLRDYKNSSSIRCERLTSFRGRFTARTPRQIVSALVVPTNCISTIDCIKGLLSLLEDAPQLYPTPFPTENFVYFQQQHNIMRLINLHAILIVLVAASATASFIPTIERGTSPPCETFCILSHYFIYDQLLLQRPAVRKDSSLVFPALRPTAAIRAARDDYSFSVTTISVPRTHDV